MLAPINSSPSSSVTAMMPRAIGLSNSVNSDFLITPCLVAITTNWSGTKSFTERKVFTSSSFCRLMRLEAGRRYADGDYIHGGGGGNDFFVGGGIADGGTDFRAGVPAILCPAGGAGEDGTEELRRGLKVGKAE